MQDSDAYEPHSSDAANWNELSHAHGRFSAARANGRDLDHEEIPGEQQSDDLAKRRTSIVSITQLGQAVAEIERAAAALRRAEPALELGIPRSIPAGEVRNYRSVWIMIGA